MDVCKFKDSTSVLCFAYTCFFSRGECGPTAGAGLADAWMVKGILKRLFSCSQRRAKGGDSGIPSVAFPRRGWLHGVVVGGILSSRRPFS